jgi:hypothetical protein
MSEKGQHRQFTPTGRVRAKTRRSRAELVAPKRSFTKL